MTIEKTPLFNESGETKATKIGIDTLNGTRIDVYSEPFDLPGQEQKRDICEQHLDDGVGSELISEFHMSGCDYDAALEEGVIRVQFSCVGQSALRKKCRARLTQYDSRGNVLNTGKIV